ncbi:MAG: hypothetical protein V4531_00065 [Actinomycetota bacterium]
MKFPRRIVLTGAVTLGVFALGSFGAAAVAQTLTIGDRTGTVQGITPVITGTTNPTPGASSPAPSESPAAERSDAPRATTTVEPADPVYVNAHGDVEDARASGDSDYGSAPDVSDDTNRSGRTGGSGDTSGSGGSTSGSGSPRDDGGSTGPDSDGGSDDTGGKR